MIFSSIFNNHGHTSNGKTDGKKSLLIKLNKAHKTAGGGGGGGGGSSAANKSSTTSTTSTTTNSSSSAHHTNSTNSNTNSTTTTANADHHSPQQTAPGGKLKSQTQTTSQLNKKDKSITFNKPVLNRELQKLPNLKGKFKNASLHFLTRLKCV